MQRSCRLCRCVLVIYCYYDVMMMTAIAIIVDIIVNTVLLVNVIFM